MDKNSRVFIAGHRGLVGSAIVRKLHGDGFRNLLLRDRSSLDLTNQADVQRFFCTGKPEYIFLAAAKVGGIAANDTFRGDFIRVNLQIQTNVIDAAYRHDVRKLLFLGSSCIYPKHAPQPLKEEYLLTGPLEPTNRPYAVSKIAGIEMVQAYRDQYGFDGICLMPTNLYGPGDNFDLQTSHVLPALMRKFHDAVISRSDRVVIWGSGKPRREFLHVDDLADAALFLMQCYSSRDIINVGSGRDVSIAELAAMICQITAFQGEIGFDFSKPDGVDRKLLDVTRLSNLGWSARIGLQEGIQSTYEWYLNRVNEESLAASVRL